MFDDVLRRLDRGTIHPSYVDRDDLR